MALNWSCIPHSGPAGLLVPAAKEIGGRGKSPLQVLEDLYITGNSREMRCPLGEFFSSGLKVACMKTPLPPAGPLAGCLSSQKSYRALLCLPFHPSFSV